MEKAGANGGGGGGRVGGAGQVVGLEFLAKVGLAMLFCSPTPVDDTQYNPCNQSDTRE
jgi:hypothetical protein